MKQVGKIGKGSLRELRKTENKAGQNPEGISENNFEKIEDIGKRSWKCIERNFFALGMILDTFNSNHYRLLCESENLEPNNL